MVKRVVSLRLDSELYNTLPEDNRSEWIRDIIKSYIGGDLIKDTEIKGIEKENKLLLAEVEDLKKDKEHLQHDKEFLEIQLQRYLPKPKKYFWQFWKK